MFSRIGKIDEILGVRKTGGIAVPPDDAWDAMLQLAQAMPNCHHVAEQIRLTLHAIQRGIEADAVFWHTRTCSEATAVATDMNLSSQWCHDFAEEILANAPGVEGQLLCTKVPAGNRRPQPRPCTAALVQVSRTNQIWIAAVGFDPRRCFGRTQVKIMAVARQIMRNQIRRHRVYSRMSETMFWLAQCLTTAIDARVPHSTAHSERVGQIAVRIGQEMRLTTPLISDTYFAGLLHDIGKTGISESLLHKAGQLSREEQAQIREYPVIGERMLAGIDQLAHLRSAVRNHRERFDGQGYPDRLAGKSIPVIARILAVADAFDAMLSPRPYRAAIAGEEAQAILVRGAGTVWDPEIVDKFVRCRKDIGVICRSGSDGASMPAMGRIVAGWNDSSSRPSPAQGKKVSDSKGSGGTVFDKETKADIELP